MAAAAMAAAAASEMMNVRVVFSCLHWMVVGPGPVLDAAAAAAAGAPDDGRDVGRGVTGVGGLGEGRGGGGGDGRGGGQRDDQLAHGVLLRERCACFPPCVAVRVLLFRQARSV